MDLMTFVTVFSVLMAAFAAGVYGWAIGRKHTEVDVKRQIDSGFQMLRHRLRNEDMVRQAENRFQDKKRAVEGR